MKIRDINEYGSTPGPAGYGGTQSMSSLPKVTTGTQPPKPTDNKPGNKNPEPIPGRARNVKPIKTAKDLLDINSDDPKAPVGVYDKAGKIVAIAARPKTGSTSTPPVLIDPKTKKPLSNLRGLYVSEPPKTESVIDRFMSLTLEEQLRIVESIDTNKLDRILHGKK